MYLLTLIAYLSPVLLVFTLYVYKKYSYWSSRGLRGPRPTFPFGYLLKRVRSHPIDYELKNLKEFGRFYGTYIGLSPTVTISDIELIKNVMIKDFHLFVNRRQYGIQHKYYSNNLFMVESNDWKRIRSITSPAFTSGKLRKMYTLLKLSTDKLGRYLDSVCKDETLRSSVNIKSVIVGFTIDVIASTSFSIDADTNGDRLKFNPFLFHGQQMIHGIKTWAMVMMLTMPKWIPRGLGILHPFPEESFQFFVKISEEILRKTQTTNEENLVKLIKEAHISEDDLKTLNYNKLTATADNENEQSQDKSESSNEKFLTHEEIISQAILFFTAGFETTSSAITNTIFEMVHQPELQDRLFQEIQDCLGSSTEDNLDEYYEKIQNACPYLDAVLKETLRKYPPLTRLERRLSADGYKLGDVVLEKDTLVEISTIAVHYDPANYPDPHHFDPERFMPENKHKLIPYSYLPFGIGPRNCIGMRFAYQEAKIALVKLFRNYRFHKTDKTPESLVFKIQAGLFAEAFDISISKRI